MRVPLVLAPFGVAAIAILPILVAAAAPPSHVHGSVVTIRDDVGVLVRWGAISSAQCCREEAEGRVVSDGEPTIAEQRTFYFARDGHVPGGPPACQVWLDVATGKCRGWRYGGPAADAPAGCVTVQREPTAGEQAWAAAELERLGRRRRP